MYQVWVVFKNKGEARDYYVINTTTKRVQSVWFSLQEANQVVSGLNALSKREAF